MSKHYHPFHLVDPSPWPYVGSFGALGMTTGGVMYMHSYLYGDLLLLSSMTIIILVMIVWWRDVIGEATFQGHHTLIVQEVKSITTRLLHHSIFCKIILFFISLVIYFIVSKDVSCTSIPTVYRYETLSPLDHANNWQRIGLLSQSESQLTASQMQYNITELRQSCAQEWNLLHGGEAEIIVTEVKYDLLCEYYTEYNQSEAIVFPAIWDLAVTRGYLYKLRFDRVLLANRTLYREMFRPLVSKNIANKLVNRIMGETKLVITVADQLANRIMGAR